MSDIRTAAYLVGIDFGDGETTASVISFDHEGRSLPVRSLNIFDLSMPDRQKVESCIYQKKDGSWDLAFNDTHFSRLSLKTNFKNKPSELRRQKEATISNGLPECEQKEFQLKTFIKLVFERILENNPDLRYDPETQEKNFYLVAACPSKWAIDPMVSELEQSDEINAYKNLMCEVIPIDAVIKESDAAFYHFLDQKLFPSDNTESLVIDFGSSTIDYTLFRIHDGTKEALSDGSRSRDLGASKVEAAFQEYLESSDGTHDTFQAAKDKWDEMCQVHHVSHMFWEPAIRHNLKMAKEGYYGARMSEMPVHVPLTAIWAAPDASGKIPMTCLFYNTSLTATEIEDEDHGCLKDYKEAVQVEFSRIAAKWNPDHIIITGGASRMPWVREAVIKAFSSDGKLVSVEVDKITPSYVVSHGCAQYLLAYRKFMLEFDRLEQEIADWDELKSDFIIRLRLEKAFNDAIGPKYTELLKQLLDEYRRGDCDKSISGFGAILKDFKLTISEKYSPQDIQHCNHMASEYLSALYAGLVSDKVNQVFSRSFSIDIKVPIRINFTNLISSFQIIRNTSEERFLQEILAQNYWHHIPGCIMTLDPRKDSDREFIVNHYPVQLNATLREDSWDDEVNAIRTCVKTSVSELRKQIPFTLYE